MGFSGQIISGGRTRLRPCVGGGGGYGVFGSSGVEWQECRQVWVGRGVSSEKVSQASCRWATQAVQTSLATKGPCQMIQKALQ